MSDQTNIEWADSTFNPWMGCAKVSPACDHCYAERDTKRFGRVEWGAGKPRVRTSAANWKLPERWNKAEFVRCENCGHRADGKPWFDATEAGGVSSDGIACAKCGSRDTEPVSRRVFCASLADWLDNEVPIEWLVDLLDLIRRTPNLDWLLLTKRIGNWRARLDAAYHCARPDKKEPESDVAKWIGNWLCTVPPANVWLGSTMIDRPEMLRDAEKLARVPAAVLFWSVEPMLGDFGVIPKHLMPNWIIAGGESGPHARPMHPDWIRSLRDQCAAAGVAFLLKQWGEWLPFDMSDDESWYAKHRYSLPLRWWDGERWRDAEGEMRDDALWVARCGKKSAGRKLDGIEHDGFPAAQP
ncbi:MAG: hypothetical protein C0434_07880 [Xanthomonadaceae bacterium]|nr:hypothetical protein [Xanthomonadaceae bacterium]